MEWESMGYVLLADGGKKLSNCCEGDNVTRCSIECGVFLNLVRKYSCLKKGSVPHGLKKQSFATGRGGPRGSG